METRVAASVLWLRALFAGTFAVFLGTVGHVMADGLLPAPSFVAFLYVGTVLGSVPFLARPATLPRLLVLLVGGQTFIHLCLTVTAGHRGDPATSSAAPRPHLGGASLPTVDGRRVGSFQEAFHGTAAQPAQTPTLPLHHLVADLHAHAPMMAAHLVAAALVALWLAHGERVVFALLVATAALVLALVRPVLPVAPAPLRRPSLPLVAAVRLRDLLLGRALSRRGPPLLAA
jgi:hypothetical protein